MSKDLGLCFHRHLNPLEVVEHAGAAERLGFDEFWVIEDCFYTTGVSLAAAALTATSEITVGLGIMPAVARTAAMTAMEIATLGGLGPGRFHAGIGHGVQSWMEQMGVKPASPLTALDETVTNVKRLLAGDEVTFHGDYVTLEKVALDVRPDQVPLVSTGVRGPKSLALSGRVADGTIFADFVSADYVRWAREQIGTDDHRITVFASLAIDPDGGNDARMGMSHHLADVAADAPISLRMADGWDELEAKAGEIGWLEACQAQSADWWRTVAPVGTAADAIAYIESIFDAGADAVAVFPGIFTPLDDAAAFAAHVLPHFQD